ncbi:hypothetical protein KIW84_012297 [Lathyrus oleraceus]|uniref:Uncharacterized protein n=1 Tax=Pisum sativum TaxID=3888 RepID=A0A9D5GW34_PEA|nr:hypothetical protein KIW84_012297 [Pisum sativum]
MLELARLLKQEEKVIQPHAERVEIVIPGTAEVRKKVKVGAASEASRKQNGSPVERACGCLHLVMSGYARVEYRCRREQATMERGSSSREAERPCLYQRAMVTLFHEMIHHEIDCYVDDMIAKSHAEVGHLADRGKSVDRFETIQTEAARRLRQYMLVHTTLWISKMDLIKYISEKPAMTGRVAKGPMILIEYDIRYISQKAIEGSVLSDYVAPQPIEGYQPRKFEFPDEDISRCSNRKIESFVARITFECTNDGGGIRSWYPGYRTSVRTSTGATPFSLVYGMEAVLPVEVQIPSLRVLMDVKLQEAEWVRTRYEELSLIEEKRLATICHGQLYQQRMKCAFDRKVRPRVYHVGDMVLKRILPPQNDRRGQVDTEL